MCRTACKLSSPDQGSGRIDLAPSIVYFIKKQARITGADLSKRGNKSILRASVRQKSFLSSTLIMKQFQIVVMFVMGKVARRLRKGKLSIRKCTNIMSRPYTRNNYINSVIREQ